MTQLAAARVDYCVPGWGRGVKKALLVFGVLGLCEMAQAQSSVTLYGSTDVGVGYFNNAGAGAKVTTVNTMQPDRFGLYGLEDLGSGVKTLFRLEGGFSTSTGAMTTPGVIFNRQAYVGLSDDSFGTLTMGRQTPFSFDWLGPLSSAYLTANWYMFHPGNIDELAATGVVPYQNSAKFVSQRWDGLTVGTMLGLGNTTNFGLGRNFSVGAEYEGRGLKAAVTYADEHNRTPQLSTLGIASFQGQPAATYSADRIENMGAGVSYNVGAVTFHALFTLVKLKSDGESAIYQTCDAGATYQPTPADSLALGASTTRFSPARYTEFSLGNVYALSKSTQLYADVVFETANGGAKAAIYTIGASSTRNQLGFLTGIHHGF